MTNNILPKIERVGLALDIDETLSWTVGYWVEEMQKLFGNPENLSVEQIIIKYRYTQNVPYWNSSEATSWMEGQRHSNETQTKLKLIKDADIYVHKISAIVPIVAYITIRPESVVTGTRTWLIKHGFPDVPIICKPSNISATAAHEWKAKILEQLYSNIIGIVDDNNSILKFLKKDYPGKIFLYDSTHLNIDTNLDVVVCKDWKTVYTKILEIYKDRKN